MIGSLFTGISGMTANANAMTVIGDNIANVNTPGFKGSTATFSNILNQAAGQSGTTSYGTGVMMTGASPIWNAGSLENSTSVTDLAINGEGLFVVRDDSGMTYYTRAGSFTFDKDGQLVNSDGLALQAYEILDGGSLGTIGEVAIPEGMTAEPNETSEMRMGVNLDAGAETGTEYTSTITVFDSLGNAIPLTLTFTKQDAAVGSLWNVDADIPVLGGSSTATVSIASIAFDEDGMLSSPAANPTVTLGLDNGAAPSQTITWNLYNDAGLDNADISGYSSASTTSYLSQDGYAAGNLQAISIGQDGTITGQYSNGNILELYRIALADFPSYSGLNKIGGNLYAESIASGQVIVGTPGSGSLGSLSPYSLEMSNVDLAAEFVKLITTQRAFQANSRVITTSDEMLSELVNIKR